MSVLKYLAHHICICYDRENFWPVSSGSKGYVLLKVCSQLLGALSIVQSRMTQFSGGGGPAEIYTDVLGVFFYQQWFKSIEDN